MKSPIGAVFLFIGMSWCIPAQGADACGDLMAAFEHSDKYVATKSAEESGDDSVYRAMLAELQINNELLRQQINLTLIVQRHCSLPDHEVSAARYLLPAMKCNLALMQGKKIDETPDCDMNKWTPK